MLQVFVVVATLLTGICIVAFAISTIVWMLSKSERPYSTNLHTKNAKVAIACLAGIPLSWTWPLTAVIGLVYLITRLVREAFPSGIHKNELN